MSHNGIKKIEGLDKCAKLRVLDIGTNFVTKVEGLENCPDLEELWV
jgi:protein phosphatase 1 regulatory subunit 7